MQLEVLNGIGSILIAIGALLTAFVALRKTKVDYSATIVEGFNTLLESYTHEITRLGNAAIESSKNHRKELHEQELEHKEQMGKLHDKYKVAIDDLNAKIKDLQERVEKQDKTILRQANMIAEIQGR